MVSRFNKLVVLRIGGKAECLNCDADRVFLYFYWIPELTTCGRKLIVLRTCAYPSNIVLCTLRLRPFVGTFQVSCHLQTFVRPYFK